MAVTREALLSPSHRLCGISEEPVLILIDTYSKWMEVVPVFTPSAEARIPSSRVMFASRELPDIILSDNGPTFVSSSFKNFLWQNGIRQLLTLSYHPE